MGRRILTLLPIVFILTSIACKSNFPDSETQKEIAIQTPVVEITEEPTKSQTKVRDLRIVWSAEYNIEPGVFSNPYIFIDGDQLFIETNEGTIQSREISSGNILWETSPAARVMGVDEKYLYLKPSPLRIDLIDKNNGNFINNILINLLDDTIAYPLITSKNNFLVPISHSSELGAYTGYVIINKHNGSLVSDSSTSYHWSIYSKNEVYVFRTGEYIRGISLETGEVLWELISGQDIKGIPSNIIECGDILFIENFLASPEELLAVNPINGKVLWKLKVNLSTSKIICHQETPFGIPNLYKIFNPKIEKGHEIIYLSSKDVDLNPLFYAINRSDGKVMWLGNEYTRPYPARPGSYIFLGSTANLVVYSHKDFGFTQAYSINEHELVWENPNIVLEEMIGVLDNVLIGFNSASSPDLIIGLDINSGKILWNIEEEDKQRLGYIVNNYLFFWDLNSLQFIDPKLGIIYSTIPIEKWFGDAIAYHDGLLIEHSSGSGVRTVSLIKP